jgi:anti-anti-sigma factor
MEYQTIERGDATWIGLSGALDAVGTLEAQEVARRVVRSTAKTVTLDLTHLAFVDPSGIGLIVFLFKRLRASGRSLEILGVHGQPARLLRQLKLHRPLNITFLPERAAVDTPVPVLQPLRKAS